MARRTCNKHWHQSALWRYLPKHRTKATFSTKSFILFIYLFIYLFFINQNFMIFHTNKISLSSIETNKINCIPIVIVLRKISLQLDALNLDWNWELRPTYLTTIISAPPMSVPRNSPFPLQTFFCQITHTTTNIVFTQLIIQPKQILMSKPIPEIKSDSRHLPFSDYHFQHQVIFTYRYRSLSFSWFFQF